MKTLSKVHKPAETLQSVTPDAGNVPSDPQTRAVLGERSNESAGVQLVAREFHPIEKNRCRFECMSLKTEGQLKEGNISSTLTIM